MAAPDQVNFQQLMSSLLSTDNDVRSKAEEVYNALPCEAKVPHLLGTIQNPQMTEEARMLSAVLLRRLVSAEFQEFYEPLPPEAKDQLKQQILLTLQQNEVGSMRRKICEMVAEVARCMIDAEGNNEWPEFLQFLFHCASAPSVQLQESALRIFASVPGIFGNQQAQHLPLIKQMLCKYLDPSSDQEVRFQAVRAYGAFILLHDKEEDVKRQFADLLPRVIHITAESVEQDDPQNLMQLLIDMAEGVPKFFRPQLEQIFELCLKIFSTVDMEDNLRHLALEMMVSLAENAPAMVRKRAEKYIAVLVPLVLQMMTDLEDNEEWSVSDKIAEDDTGDNNIIAESALDRLACGLGGKMVLPYIANNISGMLTSPDWKQRHAALMAISAAGEGCQKQMEAMLESIMQNVLKYLMDPHPRVRYAACNAIGQMATDFAPIFEKKFHEQVIPGLLNLLDDVDNPRVQAHAGAALVNFSEDCPRNILTRYLDAIMAKLVQILTSKFEELVKKGTKLVLEQVVTTIASVADTTEKDFVVYYDRLMPSLKYIIKEGNRDDLRLLRGKTIECVSLIGLAVGAEKFMTDASDVMDMLLKTHTEGDLPDDDPQTSYLISAWARICKILGKQFEQFLPLVMGPVMRTASMKPEVAMLDNDEMQGVENDSDWQFVNLGEQQNFVIRTAGLEDKASACEMLVCYARELKDGFANYAEEVVRLMVPMLKFYFHDGVRTAAAESLPYLLDCAKIKGPKYLEGMWLYICPELLKAIDSEPEPDVLAELLHSLGRCIETLGAACLSNEAMEEVLKLVDKFMTQHFEKEEKRAQARKEEDYDDGVEERLAEEDDADVYLLSRITDIIHALFVTYKEAFLPSFQRLVAHFVKLLNPASPWADRQWGLCIFDDLIEFTGPMCAQYQAYFLQPMLEYVKDEQPEVRQAAVYGFGVLGLYGGEHFSVTCAQAIPVLMEIIMAPDSREPENVNPTENAISAITKILKYNNKAITNPDEIIALWFSWLPVGEDEDEAVYVYGYLCDLIQANHPVVLGENNANLPRIVSIIASCFYREAVTVPHPEAQRMLSIVKQIEANPDLFQACINQLTAEQKTALESAYRAAAAAVTTQ
ncbi:importin-5 [Anopheles bellator]|uniref:importin-5 n=1 Tax=Anopheles bellator TaxID=139047 RepID=UPI00264949C6|nr:importin-5 [Anopheles bellator]